MRTPHGQLGIQAMVKGRARLHGDAVTMAGLTDILGERRWGRHLALFWYAGDIAAYRSVSCFPNGAVRAITVAIDGWHARVPADLRIYLQAPDRGPEVVLAANDTNLLRISASSSMRTGFAM